MVRVAAFVVACVVATACGAGSSSARDSAGRLGIQVVARNLASPTYLTSAPGEPKTLYVVEQPGRILALTGSRQAVFLDIRDRVKSGGEQGLLSVAFHPGYAKNHRFYVDYTDVNGNTRVVEYRSRNGKAVDSSARQLLFVDQPYSNHNGGQLAFGPDGKLYVGMGDGGSGGDPENRAQNMSTQLGKLLRTNPTAKKASWQIAGYGLRNPWRFSFDRKTGDLWIGDVGQNAWEEVDHRTRTQLAKHWNYGWPVYEGRHSYKSATLTRRAPLVRPVAEYSHAGGRCSITGGYVYRGSNVPAAAGRYFYGDYCSGEVWSRKGGSSRKEVFEVPQIASFGEDAAGELYLVLAGRVGLPPQALEPISDEKSLALRRQRSGQLLDHGFRRTHAKGDVQCDFGRRRVPRPASLGDRDPPDAVVAGARKPEPIRLVSDSAANLRRGDTAPSEPLDQGDEPGRDPRSEGGHGASVSSRLETSCAEFVTIHPL